MISDTHKFVFVEMPKTGTTTIAAILEKYKSLPSTEDRDSIAWRHRSASEIKKSFDELGKDWDDYFVFTFVRNPYDRIVSLYSFMHKTIKDYETHAKPKNRIPPHMDWVEMCYEVTGKNPTFKDYVKSLEGEPPDPLDDIFHFTHEGETKLVDFVGRFENLQKDFNIVCDKIGIPKHKLPHKNKSEHSHYSKYYDDNAIRIVRNRFEKSIEYFGYDFGKRYCIH